MCIDGVLPLISAICEKITLAEIIDTKIDMAGGKIVSAGNAVKAIILN